MSKYSLKMYARKNVNGENLHLSGAERILGKTDIANATTALIERGFNHEKGEADFINLKIEEIDEDDILYLPALAVSKIACENPVMAKNFVVSKLAQLGIDNGEKIYDLIEANPNLSGAMLVDADTLCPLGDCNERGIRATFMDSASGGLKKFKNHFAEALILATKVAYCPNIIAEICISDDPNYTTGYIASKELGYIRLENMKTYGSAIGGRIFIYKSSGVGKENDIAQEIFTQTGKDDIENAISYLEKQCVLVTGIENAILESANIDNNGINPKVAKENKWQKLEEYLENAHKNQLYRSTKALESAQSSYVFWQGRKCLMLASNSYLDLCNNEEVKSYTKKIIDLYGVGSGGSRLTTGNTVIHDQLESALAEFKGTEAALVFNTGYSANLGILEALTTTADVIFTDELNHASIIDGCKISKAEVVIYKHNDMADLAQKAAAHCGKFGIIVSDAVFSMDGDIANLPEIMNIANKFGFLSMVDEAHSTGVIGKTGKGIVEHFALTSNPDILMGTLSKSLGSEGGFVCGSHTLIEYLRHKARAYVFSTSLAPSTMAASYKALEILKTQPNLVEKLQHNIAHFTAELGKNGIEAHSQTAIVPIIIGDEGIAMEVSAKLLDMGYFISAIRYPTVAKGAARLRVALMSSHTDEELAQAAKDISEVLKSFQ